MNWKDILKIITPGAARILRMATLETTRKALRWSGGI